MNHPTFVKARVTNSDAPQWAGYGALSDHVMFVLASGLDVLFPFGSTHEFDAHVMWTGEGDIGYITFTNPKDINPRYRVDVAYEPCIIVGSQVLGIIDNADEASRRIAA